MSEKEPHTIFPNSQFTFTGQKYALSDLNYDTSSCRMHLETQTDSGSSASDQDGQDCGNNSPSHRFS